MKKGKAFILVGHKNWGKSATLRALTNGIHQIREITIQGYVFVIRRMSNDDPPADALVQFFLALNPASEAQIIITLCPDFESEVTITILNTLRAKYELFFWVMKNSYDGHRQISQTELEELGRYGTVKIFLRKEATPEERANELRRFIEKSV